MKSRFTTAMLTSILVMGSTPHLFATSIEAIPQPPVEQKIQVAILLDVSSSMDGLIEQAKGQLWNMVNVMGRVRCGNDDKSPKVEIALYEYGRQTNDPERGYIKKLNGFISDLDSLSQNLFQLTTNGGDEYCSQVIYRSLQDLEWDKSSDGYRVIFICGNEEFRQGKVSFTTACAEAKKKGVIVNTIYCGDRETGLREHWNLGSECNGGSFTNIDQNAKMEDIATPYDSLIFYYNGKLNGTYISYGKQASYGIANQAKQDTQNTSMSKTAGLKRAISKSNSKMYNNAQWDLVDAKEKEGDVVFEKLSKEDLPDDLKNKSMEEIKTIVTAKSVERGKIQKEMTVLTAKRTEYIAAEKAKAATTAASVSTLETAVERMIKEQVKLYKMRVE